MRGVHKRAIERIQTTGQADLVASMSKDMVVVWRLSNSEVLVKWSTPTKQCTFAAMDVLFQRNVAVALTNGGHLIVFNTKTGETVHSCDLEALTGTEWRLETTWRPQLCVSPTGNKVFATSPAEVVVCFDMKSRSVEDAAVHCIAREEGRICSLEIIEENVIAVFRSKSCCFYNLREKCTAKTILFECYDSKPFVAECHSFRDSKMCVLSETGVILLFDLSKYSFFQLDTPFNEEDPAEPHLLSKKTVGDEDKKMQFPPIESERRLKQLLLQYGGYPSKYRRMIWKRLLVIPLSRAAFQELLSRQLPSSNSMKLLFPCHSPDSSNKQNAREDNCLVHLTKWSPTLLEVAFVPGFMKPFVQMFGADGHVLFEVLATILMNWGRPFLENYPDPPWDLLSRLSLLLKVHDPQLHSQLESTQSTRAFLWELLSSGMARVLHMSDWMLAWDHILTNDISFLFYMIVALAMEKREVWIKAVEEDQIKAALSISHSVDIVHVVARAYELVSTTPERQKIETHFLRPLKSNCFSYPRLLGSDTQATSVSCKGREDSSVPSYLFTFPQSLAVVDQGIRMSLDDIRQDEEAIHRNQRVLEQLEEQTLELERRLENQHRRLGNPIVQESAFSSVAPMRKDADIMEALARRAERDLREVEDRVRNEKLKHVRIMNTMLDRQETESRQTSKKLMRERRISANRRWKV